LSVVLLILVLLAALSPTFWFDSKTDALSWFEHVDKWLHGITFVVLSVWFAGLFARRSYGWIAAGLMLFGLLIEACQLLVGYRMADWLDVGANTAGIIIGLVLAAVGLGGWGLRVEAWYSGRQPV
jgi:glycopeptide antibiotics resistance protein